MQSKSYYYLIFLLSAATLLHSMHLKDRQINLKNGFIVSEKQYKDIYSLFVKSYSNTDLLEKMRFREFIKKCAGKPYDKRFENIFKENQTLKIFFGRNSEINTKISSILLDFLFLKAFTGINIHYHRAGFENEDQFFIQEFERLYYNHPYLCAALVKQVFNPKNTLPSIIKKHPSFYNFFNQKGEIHQDSAIFIKNISSVSSKIEYEIFLDEKRLKELNIIPSKF